MSEKKLVTLKINGESKEGLKSSVYVRDLPPFIVDEPERLGGTNQGPNPLEYLLGALSACTNIIISYVAKEQDFSYDGVEFSADGELDPRGFLGVEGVLTYFQTVTINISLKSDESDEKLATLKETVEKRCPLFNLLKDARVKVETNWSKE
jgi:uncharacterized OsmC-like protein